MVVHLAVRGCRTWRTPGEGRAVSEIINFYAPVHGEIDTLTAHFETHAFTLMSMYERVYILE